MYQISFILFFVSLKVMLVAKHKIFALVLASIFSIGALSLMPLDANASHSFEAGVVGNSVPDNTHIDLSGLELPPGGVVPLYDASPNFVSGHFLYRTTCDNPYDLKVSVIAGHIDEHSGNTYVDFVPLYYISHASPPGVGSCVYHAHIPDPVNGGAPRATDVDLVNYSEETVIFNQGDAVDMNVQRVLGSIGTFYQGNSQVPLDPDLVNGNNPVFDLNDGNLDNDGLGFPSESSE